MNYPHWLAYLEHELRLRGEQTLFTYLDNGEHPSERLTLTQLDLRARQVAMQLLEVCSPGERVLLLYPAGLSFITALFGCFYSGLIAVPAPPPEAGRIKRTLPRLQRIISDCGAHAVLTTNSVSRLLDYYEEELAGWNNILLFSFDYKDDGTDTKSWAAPSIDPGTIAYLQYTSGSTTSPKGVVLTHANLLSHCAAMRKVYGYTPESVSLTWMPNYHDYGLVQGLLVPLYSRTPSYIMSAYSFMRQPGRWLNALSRLKVSHSQGPNFSYDQCVRRAITDSDLDLTNWISAGCGAEPINPAVLDAFHDKFKASGFRREAFAPGYGLAEATLAVTSCPDKQPLKEVLADSDALARGRFTPRETLKTRRLIGCGPPIPGVSIRIVDPESLAPCAPGRIGEIWSKGHSVAAGYWSNAQATRETFQARTADGDGFYLRTGDLGFMHQGELFVTGRRKDVIILRGANHYPQDIEWTVQRVDSALRSENGAAFGVNVEGTERLVVVQEVERRTRGGIDTEALLDTIRHAVVTNHDRELYAVVLIKAGSLPKTSSGKIQRAEAAIRFLAGDLEVLAQWRTGGAGIARQRTDASNTLG